MAIGAALLACVLVTCLPTSVFRLNVCDCGDVVLEPSSDGDRCCCEAESTDDRSDQPRDPASPGDACCTDLPLPDLLVKGSGSSDDAPDATQADGDFTASTLMPVPRAPAVRRLSAWSTGPPGWHRTRRALLERDATVLLI